MSRKQENLYISLAQKCHTEEKEQEALNYVKRAIEKNGIQEEFLLWELLLLSLLRDNKCEEIFLKVKLSSGQLADIALGEYFYYKYNYLKAYEYARSAHNRDERDIEAILLLLRSMDALGLEQRKYQEIWTRVNEIEDVRVKKIILRILYKNEEYEACNKLAKRVVRTYPNTEVSEFANTILRKTRDKLKKREQEDENLKTRMIPRERGGDIPEVSLENLNQLIGMKSVKDQINAIYKSVMFEKKRKMLLKRNESKETSQSYHFVFSGNPGTGKTTVARLFGEIFHGLGILEKGQLIETDRSGLVGEHIGHTAQKTKKVIEEAMGGVLFIDEAYSLYNKEMSARDFGREAIDTLVKAIEDNRDKFIVILAGYKDEMKELMKSNPGLESRFTKFVEFPDYSEEELLQIAEKMARDNEYTLSENGKKAFRIRIRKSMVDEKFGNARTVRNIINEAFEYKAMHSDLTNLSIENITVLTEKEFGVNLEERPEEKAVEYIDQLKKLIGLKTVKDDVCSLIDTINYQKEEQIRMGDEFHMPSLHMVFQGNPGTGKTTVARIYGNLLREMGILAKGQFIEVSRADLIGRYQGETALQVKEKCKDAYGGILFIDEAYSLCSGDGEHDTFGQEAVSTLIKEMEDNRDKLVVILAGYDKEMKEFLSRNSGFVSRISKTLQFDDYTADELFEIFCLYCKQEKFMMDREVEEQVSKIMIQMEKNKNQNFGNARDVRKYFEKAKRAMVSRVQKNKIQGGDRRKIEMEDL